LGDAGENLVDDLRHLTASAAPEIAFGCMLVAFPLIGAVARVWPAVLAPIVGWPLFYLGLDEGWWLYGTGDRWSGKRSSGPCSAR
jgi:hypothetical protein